MVVAVILIVQALNGGSGHHGAGGSPVVSAPASTPTSSAPTPSLTPSAGSPTPAVRTSATPTPHPRPVTTPPPAATPVAVFNVSRVSGRAALAASALHRAGYYIVIIATRRYATPGNVVYFPPGNASLAAAARALVARHLGITVAAPRPVGVPASADLVVLVTGTYR
jgi:hypothetical protein